LSRHEERREMQDLFFAVGEYPAARVAAEELLTLARRVGDRRSEATALIQGANAAQWMEDFDAALVDAREAVEVSEASGDQFGLAGALSVHALVAAHHIVQHPPVSRWMTWRYAMHCFATMGELALA
jgi:hypothetical protein